MISTCSIDRETQLTNVLLKFQDALEDIREYYKFGRHTGLFPEKLYLLFSHCAHLLFDLWLAEKETPVGTFKHDPSLDMFIADLSFDALRYVDYRRRTLHIDAYEEHLKNEPAWFKFWVRAVEKQNGGSFRDNRELTQHILSHTSDKEFLEGTMSTKKTRTLARAMKTDTVAQLLSRSASVVESVISAAVSHLATLDQSSHTAEQIASLICMLRQARLTVINDVPAEGPYALFSNKGWGRPRTLFHLLSGKKQGRLRVVPKRDGGGIICTYTWTGDGGPGHRSWTRAPSTLSGCYEEQLFKTWAYDTGNYHENASAPAKEKAYWQVQSAEAKRLKIIFSRAETAVQALATNSRCAGLIAEINAVLPDNQPTWRARKLEWTYISKIDRLVEKLKSAYREARVLGGMNPGAEVVARMWPPGQRVGPKPAPKASPASNSQRMLPQWRFSTASRDRSENSIVHTFVGNTLSPPGAGDPAGHINSEARTDSSPDHCAANAPDLGAPFAMQASTPEKTAAVPRSVGDGRPDAALAQLRQVLLNKHQSADEGVNCRPLAYRQLQQELNWTWSQVQNAMTGLFGPQPSTVYRQKCRDRTICHALTCSDRVDRTLSADSSL